MNHRSIYIFGPEELYNYLIATKMAKIYKGKHCINQANIKYDMLVAQAVIQ